MHEQTLDLHGRVAIVLFDVAGESLRVAVVQSITSQAQSLVLDLDEQRKRQHAE